MKKNSFYEIQIKQAVECIENLRNSFKNREDKQGTQSKVFDPFISEFTDPKDLLYPVISILGPRGSGKTTLLHDLINRLNSESRGDLTIPVIHPEKFAANDHPLLWILAVLKKCIRDMDSTIKEKDQQYRGIMHDYTSLYKQVFLYILNTQEDGYRSFVGRTGSIDTDIETLFVDGYDLFASGYHLKEEIKKFVKRLTDDYRKIIKKNGKYKEPPLIIVAIDDVDICMDHFPEILKFISICLSEMTRFVLIVCMDHNTALNVIRDDFLSKFKIQAQGNQSSLINMIEEASEHFMIKYFPPQWRIMLKEWDFDQRRDFKPLPSYDENKKTYKKLGNILSGILLRADNNESRFPPSNLLMYFTYPYESNKHEFKLPYYDILTGNPRVLETMYHHINDWAKNVSGKNHKYKINALFDLFKEMWNITVRHRDSIFSGVPIDEIVYWDRDNHYVYFDHSRIKTIATAVYPYITIYGLWDRPFHYFEPRFITRYQDKILPQCLSAWIFFLREFCYVIGIPLGSNAIPGFKPEIEAPTGEFVDMEPAELPPMIHYSTPLDCFLVSRYYKKFTTHICKFLDNNKFKKDELVYYVNNVQDEVVFKIICHQWFINVSVLLSRDVEEDEIKKIWKSKFSEKEKLLNDMVRYLKLRLKKHPSQFIVESVLSEMHKELDKYFQKTFPEIISRNLSKENKKNIIEATNLAMDKFQKILMPESRKGKKSSK